MYYEKSILYFTLFFYFFTLSAQWEPVYNPEINIASQIVSSGNQLVIVSGAKIFTSDNEGVTWHERLQGNCPENYFMQIFPNQGSLYTYSYDENKLADIYESADNGNSWQLINANFRRNELIRNITAYNNQIVLLTASGVYLF